MALVTHGSCPLQVQVGQQGPGREMVHKKRDRTKNLDLLTPTSLFPHCLTRWAEMAAKRLPKVLCLLCSSGGVWDLVTGPGICVVAVVSLRNSESSMIMNS